MNRLQVERANAARSPLPSGMMKKTTSDVSPMKKKKKMNLLEAEKKYLRYREPRGMQ